MPPTNVAKPVIVRGKNGGPRPVSVPSSDNLSEKPSHFLRAVVKRLATNAPLPLKNMKARGMGMAGLPAIRCGG